MRINEWCSAPLVCAVISVLVGCNTKPFSAENQSQGGQGGSSNGAAGSQADVLCAIGYSACGTRCCPPGQNCVSGACQYPYQTAELYVYLCPSFNIGCTANFFQLDKTCSPIQAATPGSCYDTGFKVAANSSYGIAGCQACGSGCGNPASLLTPPGFTKTTYYSGSTWYCGTPCTAPSSCGGVPDVTGCSTYDCFLAALSLRESGQDVPLVVIAQASAPASTAADNPAQTPMITQINGTVVTSTTSTVTLTVLAGAEASADFDYDFSDPTGCSPGVCFSLPRCPKNVRCTVGTTTACTNAKHDGAMIGTVIRTLGFKTEPIDASSLQLPLQIQPIVGPVDAATGDCSDAIDNSDPEHPVFAKGVLAGDPIQTEVTLIPTDVSGGAGSAGQGGTGGSAGAGGSSSLDCTCYCPDGSVCSANHDCGVDGDGIPNPCGCPVGPPCH